MRLREVVSVTFTHCFTIVAALMLAALPARWTRGDIVLPGTTPIKLSTGYVFTEGPLYDRAGGVYFEDMHPSGQVATNPSHIVRYDIAAGLATVVDPSSGGANGDYLTASGQVVTADRERRQISLRAAGNISTVQQVLAATYNGSRFNGPNDLVIYFTDPDYENRRALPEAMYYVSPAGAVTRLVSGFSHPNGVILSPDGMTLYLALEGEKRIMAYDVTSPGVLANQRQFARTDVTAAGQTIPGIFNGPDGLTIDPAGNVYGAVQNAVWAWNPVGQQLLQLNFPEDPTNLEFGAADGKTLFVTAGVSLYGVPLNVVPEPMGPGLLVAGTAAWALRRRRRGGDRKGRSW
jgi:gluconolactonase